MHSLDWNALAFALAQLHWPQLAPAPIAVLAYFGVKASRWRFLIRPLTQVSTNQLLRPVLAGIADNYVFPHAVEIARAVLAGKWLHVPFTALLASVVIERLFDFLALLVIVVVITMPVGHLSPEIRTASVLVGALSVGILAAILIFLFHRKGCLRLADRMLARASAHLRARISRQLRAASAGLGAMARPTLLLPVLLLSVLQWLLLLSAVVFSLKAVDVPVSLASASTVLLLNVIGLTLPAAPGHLGTVQLAFTVGLAPFGVSHADAIAGSLVYNFITVAPAIILGLPSLRRAGLVLHRHLAR